MTGRCMGSECALCARRHQPGMVCVAWRAAIAAAPSLRFVMTTNAHPESHTRAHEFFFECAVLSEIGWWCHTRHRGRKREGENRAPDQFEAGARFSPSRFLPRPPLSRVPARSILHADSAHALSHAPYPCSGLSPCP